MERTFVILWDFGGVHKKWERHKSFIPTWMSDEGAIAQVTEEVLNSLTGDDGKTEDYLAGVLIFRKLAPP